MTLPDTHDNGAVSAEFAAALPAIVFFIVLCGDLLGVAVATFRAEVCVHRAAREITRTGQVSPAAAAYRGCAVSAHGQGEWVVVHAEVSRRHGVVARLWPVIAADAAVWREQIVDNDPRSTVRNARPNGHR